MKDNMLLVMSGFLGALVLLIVAATGYNYYRLDQMSERVLLDHQKIEELEKKVGTVKPQGKTGSIGSLPN